MSLNGYHIFDKNDKNTPTLYLPEIIHFLVPERLVKLKHNDIWYRGFTNEELISDEFYIRCEDAEISWPCIVVENASNPDDKKYRMIDGRHRMYKMKELGINESIFYVLELEIFNKYLKKPKVSILYKLKKWCSKEEFKW